VGRDRGRLRGRSEGVHRSRYLLGAVNILGGSVVSGVIAASHRSINGKIAPKTLLLRAVVGSGCALKIEGCHHSGSFFAKIQGSRTWSESSRFHGRLQGGLKRIRAASTAQARERRHGASCWKQKRSRREWRVL